MNLQASTVKKGITLLLLFVFSLWIRVYYIQGTEIDKPLRGDAGNYVVYAGNLVTHQIFSRDQSTTPRPDSYWAPGYPTFLAITSITAKHFKLYDYDVILTTQAVLSSTVVMLTFLIGGLFFRYGWALFAAVLTMFSPHLISYSGVLLTETLFSFLLLMAIYVFCLFLSREKTSLGVLSGGFFGLAYLTNPVVLLLPFILTVVVIVIPKNLSMKKSLPFLAIFLAIIFSWSIRNTISVGNDSANSAHRLYSNLVVGTHSNYRTIWRNNPSDPNNPATLDMREFSGSYDTFLNVMQNRIKNDPWHYLKWYFFDKPIVLWRWNTGIGFGDVFIYPVITSPYHTDNRAIASHVIMKSMHSWLFWFALLGIFIGIYHWQSTGQPIQIAIATTIYISAVYVVTQADPRYSVPLRPEMYLLAAFFFERIFYLRNQLKRKTAQT